MLSEVAREIKRIVDLYCREPTCQGAVLRALSRPGFALHPHAPCRAGTLTLKVYQAIAGTTSTAATLGAAAVELQMEAAYMFDNVADQEIDPSHGLSTAEELALAIAIMTCGSIAACEAVDQSKRRGSTLWRLIQFHRNCVDSSAGQFLDAFLERCDVATTDDALRMTFLKAGSLGRFAAEFGANLATDDADTIKLCGDFGFNTFTYAQLVDDLRDACPGNVAQGDLVRHKKTLPVAFFYQSLLQSSPESGTDLICANFDHDNMAIYRAFEDSRAEVFCAIVAEVFLNRAKAIWEDLRGRLIEVKALEEVLDSLGGSLAEVVAVP